MLEKNKDYVEFTLQTMMATHGPYQDDTEVSMTGVINGYLGLPGCLDIPCDVVVISKRHFDRLQANNEHYRELAKQREEDYNLLFKKTGFLNLEDLMCYLPKDKTLKGLIDTLEADCISKMTKNAELQAENEDLKKKLAEFAPALRYQVDLEYYRALSSSQAKSIYNWKEATGCSTPEEAKEFIDGKKKRIIELNDELDNSLSANEELKKKLQVPDPFAEYKELFEKLHSKEDVEKFEWTLNHICGGQASANGWMVTAKLWRRNYETLSKLVGFSSTEEIQDYLTNEAECDTLQEAIASLEHNVKFARDERRDLSKKLEECEKDYISERDKAEALQTENEQLKKKLGEFDFMGWMESAKLWKKRYDDIFKLIGFSSDEEIQDYLTNEAECDTLQEAVSKLKDQVKYTCDEWHSANSSNNSWKAAAECNSPKELFEKREALEKEIGVYSRALNEWKEGTGCPSPSSAKSLIESGASWHHAYNEIKAAKEKLADSIHQWQKVTGYDNPKDFLKWKANIEGIVEAWKSETGCKYPGEARVLLEKWKTLTRSETPENAAKWLERFEETDKRCDKLAREVESWKNVTGYSTPEDYMRARISGAFHTPFDYTAAWQKVTGCDTPDQVKSRIEGLENAVRLTNRNMIKEIESNIDEWQKATGCVSPVKAERKITDLYKIIEGWKKVTGCSTPEVAEDWVNELGEANGNLAQAVLSWQNVTGCSTPKDLSKKIVEWEKVFTPHMSARDLCSAMSNAIKYYKHKFAPWEEITGFSTPENCSSYIDTLEKKLEDIKDLIGED